MFEDLQTVQLSHSCYDATFSNAVGKFLYCTNMCSRMQSYKLVLSGKFACTDFCLVFLAPDRSASQNQRCQLLLSAHKIRGQKLFDPMHKNHNTKPVSPPRLTVPLSDPIASPIPLLDSQQTGIQPQVASPGQQLEKVASRQGQQLENPPEDRMGPGSR